MGVTADEEWCVPEIRIISAPTQVGAEIRVRSYFKDALLRRHYLYLRKAVGKKKKKTLTCIFIILNICWVLREKKNLGRKGDWVFLQAKCLLECMFRVLFKNLFFLKFNLI